MCNSTKLWKIICLPIFLTVVAAMIMAPILSCQRRLYYFPRAYTAAELQEAASFTRRIDYPIEAGTQRAFYIPPRPADARRLSAAASDADSLPRFVWILFSGNGGRALEWTPFLTHYNEPGTGYLLVDYPGFGICDGRPTQANIIASARGAVAALARELGSESETLPCPFGIFGHSMGAAVALELAVHSEPEAVVVLAPFTSLKDMGRKFVGRPLNSLIVDRYDNLARLKELAAAESRPRVAVLHGEKDELIPVAMGRKLAEGRAPWVSYQELKGGTHNGILSSHRDDIHAVMRCLQNGVEIGQNGE